MVTARIADGEEEQLVEAGCVSQPTETGQIFYRPAEVQLGTEPEIRMVDFWGTPGIRAKDIESI